MDLGQSWFTLSGFEGFSNPLGLTQPFEIVSFFIDPKDLSTYMDSACL